MRFRAVLVFSIWAALAVPASAQLGSFKKAPPAQPAPAPATKPAPTPAAKPAASAPPPVSPTVSKPGAAPVRSPRPAAANRTGKKEARTLPAVAVPPPPPVLQPSDYALFQASAMCRIDPRLIVSRMRPTKVGPGVTTYDLRSFNLSVNGWPVIGAYYFVGGKGGPGVVQHDLTTVVHAPASSVLNFARTLPNILPNRTEVSDDPNNVVASFAKGLGLPSQGQATIYKVAGMGSWEVIDRAREITYAGADSGNVGIITCAQLTGPPEQIMMGYRGPTKLGPIARVTASVGLDPALTAGSFRIDKSAKDGCRRLYKDATTVAALENAIRHDDWADVATQLAAYRCKSDLTYFLLGRSMEALGYPQVALAYYGEAAKLQGGTLAFSTQCSLNGGASCHGIDVPIEVQAARARIALSPPTNLGPYPLRQPS